MYDNDDEVNEEIRRLRVDRHLPPCRIARYFQQSMGIERITLQEVRKRLEDLMIPARRKQVLTANQLHDLRRAIIQGRGDYVAIGRRYKISGAQVGNYAREWGLAKTRRPLDDEILKDRYVDKLWSIHRISKECHWDEKRICARLAELGVIRKSFGVKKMQVARRVELTGSEIRLGSDGYPIMRLPEGHQSGRKNHNGWILVHVVAMEKALGRGLGPRECVHHINGDKRDFGINNLCLCESSSGHKLIHQSLENVGLKIFRTTDLIGFEPESGYYLKKKPKEEDLIDAPEPV